MRAVDGRRALAVGGAMVDTIVILENSTVERISLKNAHRSFLMLEEGQKADARTIEQHAGGGGMNTAVSLARQGFKTSLLAKVGTDPKAEMLRATLAREGIDSRFIRQTERQGTGSSVLVLAHDRNAAIFTHRGANGLLEVGDLSPEAFEVDLVYVAGLSNESADQFPAIVDLGRKEGAFVAANPGVRQLTSRTEEFWRTLAKLSLLCLNADELTLLLPHLVSAAGSESSLPDSRRGRLPFLLGRGLLKDTLHLGLIDALRVLLATGTGAVVITDGARGAYAAGKGRLLYCPSLPANVQGTTGAGDAFSSTMAACLALGASLENALRRATLNSRSVVEVVDAQSGLMRTKALEQAFAREASTMQIFEWPM